MGEVIQFPMRQDALKARLDEHLDSRGVKDQDLRDQVHERSKKWIAWLADQPKSINTRETITLDIDVQLTAEDLEKISAEINHKVVEILNREIQDWFERTGKNLLAELIVCSVNQGILEQRARDQGMTLV